MKGKEEEMERKKHGKSVVALWAGAGRSCCVAATLSPPVPFYCCKISVEKWVLLFVRP